MKSLRPVVSALCFVLFASATLFAGEPFLDFVSGLRNRDYHDMAMLYLDQLEKRADVPADVKEVISFEKAITLLDGARNLRNPEAQSKQLDQARAYLEQFLKASPNHDRAAQANTELAQVYVGKGKVEVLQSRSPNNAGQKAEFQKKARQQFAEARKVFQAAHDKYKAEYDKFDKFIPKDQKAKYEAREKAFLNYIQAQLNLAVLQYEEAQTYDSGSAENKKQLTDASNSFEQIHARYRSQLAGLYGRMWQGKCFEEMGDTQNITKAVGIYKELLGHGQQQGEKPSEALKKLQDRVRQFHLICMNHEHRKDYQLAILDAQEWIKENRGLLNTRVGLGIQWELVRALEMHAKLEETSAADKAKNLQQALNTARAINRFPGEYKDVSTAMIQRLMVALDREPGDPKDFATAFGVGRNLIEQIKRLNKSISDTRGAEQQKHQAELQEVLKEAARILNLALNLATPKDDIKDVNRARYFLSYVYFSQRDRSYESAILGEFVARKYQESQPDVALDSAYLAQAAYIQAYNRTEKEVRENRAPQALLDSVILRILGICDFITANWPASDKTFDARMNLGTLYSQTRQPEKAAAEFIKIPETAPQYLDAQLAAGNAFWYSYLVESVRPEAERKPKEQLDEMVRQAQKILQDGIAKSEAKLPQDAAPPDNITNAKLSLVQILNGSGDYKGAATLLTDGPRAVIPNSAKRPKIFLSLCYQQLLRAYVGLQDLEKARGAMKELEKIEGAGGGGAVVTKIYLELGKELEKEVKRLQAAKDPRLAEVLKSFETFLDDMFKRKEGQDYNTLMWVGETYRALGEGLEEGDSAKSSGYFSKAVAAFQTILDEEGKKAGYIPSGGQTGVQLRLVMAKRRQKNFEEAYKAIVEILKTRSKALDAQVEAAHVYQDWAARGGPDDLEKYRLAIEGDPSAKGKSETDKILWGWLGIGQRLEMNITQSTDPNPEYEKQYLDARYNVALCRFKYGLGQSTSNKRKSLLEQAQSDIKITASLSPEMGGPETYDKFNALYREIQREAGVAPETIADLEKRAKPSREDRQKAAVAAREKAAKEAKAEKKAGTENAKAEKEKPASGGSSTMTVIVTVLILLVGIGGGGYYVVRGGGKKKKRELPDLGLPEVEVKVAAPQPPRKKQPPAKSKT